MVALVMRKYASALCFLLCLLYVVLLAAPASAQVVGATLSGTVTDTSGALIPNAQVTIKNVGTGVERTVPTDTAGLYTAPNLVPGSYEVTVTAAGFATEVRSGMTLTVGAQQVLNVTLKVGAVTEKVEVTGAAPAVQLASSTISAQVNSTTVRELPLNGRSWTDLANLQPGVYGVETQFPFTSGSDRGTRGFGAQISISGARPHQNNYRLDGISLNDYSNAGPGSVLGGNLGVDAIQEFSVLTSNYSAEYGKTSGGVVNAITRSGTNRFHGSVYEFLRNSSLDARNFFDAGPVPPFRRNQFGGGAGGPIKKDRTFVFGDFEAIRQSKGMSQVSTVPSPDARNGILASGTPLTAPCPFPNSTNLAPGAASICVDNNVQKFLGLYPLPNGPILAPGDVGIFTYPAQQIINENFFTTRIDHRFSEKDSLYGTYMYDDSEFSQPDNLGAVLIGHHVNRNLVALEETHIFSPTLVNSVRLGYNRAGVAIDQGLHAINPLAADTSLGAAPGLNAPQVSVGGLSPMFNGGLDSPSSSHYYWNSFQGYDDASLTRGAHSVKFGGGVERIDFNFLAASVPGGQYNFASLSNFLTNQPKRLKLTIPGVISPRGIRQTIFGLYVQDDWRWRPNLTLNLGLRYEMSSVPSEVQGKLSVLYNPTDLGPHCERLYPGCMAAGPYFQNPTLRNFEPRVGFAWDPFHNGKTAVRGGFGLFDVLPLPVEFTIPQGTSFPFLIQESSNKLPQGSFPGGALPSLAPTTLTNVHIDQNPARNYVMQWNLNVQREIVPNLTALVGYVGSHGLHQPVKPEDMNITLPVALTPVGYIWPNPIASGPLLNPNFGDVRGVFYSGSSFYNALQIGVQKRMTHGLQFQTSYTWGKSIDTGSASGVGDTFANAIASPPWFDLRLNRGLSDYDIGQILVISVTWQVPQIHSLSGPAAWLTSGWELGSIYKANSGVPFSATFGTDGDPLGLNSTDPWDVPNRVAGCNPINLNFKNSPTGVPIYLNTNCFAVPTAPSAAYFSAPAPQGCDPAFGSLNPTDPNYLWCFNLRGNSGRNVLIGPGTSNLDFSIFKNNYVRRISETFNVQFRAEFFNILNRANFSVPVSPDNTDIFDSTGAPTGVAGLLTSTTTTSREIQFALKIIW